MSRLFSSSSDYDKNWFDCFGLFWEAQVVFAGSKRVLSGEHAGSKCRTVGCELLSDTFGHLVGILINVLFPIH